jgi:hypothetical protein
MKLVKKLSMKSMGIDGKAIAKDLKSGESVNVFRIAGTAGGVKRGESTYGTWQAFLGSFVAVDLKDQTRQFQAGMAFLPDVVTELLVKAVEFSDAETGEVGTRDVAFDLTVGIQQDDKSTTGYVYTVTPHIKLSSVADALLEQMGVAPAKQIEQEKGEEKTAAPGKANKKGK